MRGAGELSGTLTAGRYRLVRALGGDGGRVHEARHEHLGGRFAVKLFGDVEPRAFQRGAQQASALRHRGIVKVVDYGVAPGRAFIAMEWVEGRSLAAILAGGGALVPEAVARLVDSVALGLQAAHRQGVAHGHLAPARVLVLASGAPDDEGTSEVERTKILGFGPDGQLAPGSLLPEVTPYTAPEQLASDASPLADQYALGAIAYELLTGEPPARDAAPGQALRSLREYDPTINVVIDDVVQRALSPDPGARWPDVYTFAQRLREATDSVGVLEEKTRLAPLPLTVSRPPTATATPMTTPTPIELPPVIASIDVDLRTPPPRRLVDPIRKLPLQGEISMTLPPSRPTRPSQPYRPLPGAQPSSRSAPRLPSQPHYGIHPTPTFSFTDDPVPGPLYKPRRARSGGGLGLVVLVVVAGAAGYFAVQTRVWQDTGPLVERAKDLARSLRTLVPGASPERAPAPPTAATAPATAPGATTTPAPGSTTTTPLAAAPADVAPALHPDVVQIAPTSPPPTSRASQTSRHASRARHHEHAARSGSSRDANRLSDEAAAEEALLAAPSSGR